MDCSPPGSSVHGISQARILEWVAISFSSRPSWPKDQTLPLVFSALAGRFFTTGPPGKPLYTSTWHLLFWDSITFIDIKVSSVIASSTLSPGIQRTVLSEHLNHTCATAPVHSLPLWSVECLLRLPMEKSYLNIHRLSISACSLLWAFDSFFQCFPGKSWHVYFTLWQLSLFQSLREAT